MWHTRAIDKAAAYRFKPIHILLVSAHAVLIRTSTTSSVVNDRWACTARRAVIIFELASDAGRRPVGNIHPTLDHFPGKNGVRIHFFSFLFLSTYLDWLLQM